MIHGPAANGTPGGSLTPSSLCSQTKDRPHAARIFDTSPASTAERRRADSRPARRTTSLRPSASHGEPAADRPQASSDRTEERLARSSSSSRGSCCRTLARPSPGRGWTPKLGERGSVGTGLGQGGVIQIRAGRGLLYQGRAGTSSQTSALPFAPPAVDVGPIPGGFLVPAASQALPCKGGTGVPFLRSEAHRAA